MSLVQMKDSKLMQAAAIASIVAVLVAVYQFFVPPVATSQQISSSNAQAMGQNNFVTQGQNNTVNNGLSPEQMAQLQKPWVAQCEKITEALLKQYPYAFPATQQALGPAVQSIAQDAAGGDRRLQRALEFLKENKITEALPLLTADADEAAKYVTQATPQAEEKAREKAVIKYRYLGVIASLANSKQALEAYEEALELDPDDLVSLVGSGGILQSSYGDLDNLGKAKERLMRALTFSKTPEIVFCAQLCLGDIEKQQNRPSRASHALTFYKDGLATASGQLTKSGPGNAKWKFYLVYANESIGDVQMGKRDFSAARKYYQAAHETMSRLAASDKDNAVWRRALSISYQKIGDVQQAQGDLKAAVESYRESHGIIELLANSDRGNLQWQRDLSISYQKIGDVQQVQGDLRGAIESYRESYGIIEPLANSERGNVQWQRDLAEDLSKLANVHQQSGDNKKARDYLLQAQTIRMRLARLSSTSAPWEHSPDQFDRNMAP